MLFKIRNFVGLNCELRCYCVSFYIPFLLLFHDYWNLIFLLALFRMIYLVVVGEDSRRICLISISSGSIIVFLWIITIELNDFMPLKFHFPIIKYIFRWFRSKLWVWWTQSLFGVHPIWWDSKTFGHRPFCEPKKIYFITEKFGSFQSDRNVSNLILIFRSIQYFQSKRMFQSYDIFQIHNVQQNFCFWVILPSEFGF